MQATQLPHRERVAVARLHALLELLPTALDKELASLGITSFEFSLLEALAESEHGRLRLSALAFRTNASLPRLSRVVTSLERKGLAERAPCEADGRATNAVLTAEGRERYLAAAPAYAEAVGRLILGGLDHDGVEQLASLSYAILAQLDPTGRLAITADGHSAAEVETCGADPALSTCPADPLDETCAADPGQPSSVFHGT